MQSGPRCVLPPFRILGVWGFGDAGVNGLGLRDGLAASGLNNMLGG